MADSTLPYLKVTISLWMWVREFDLFLNTSLQFGWSFSVVLRVFFTKTFFCCVLRKIRPHALPSEVALFSLPISHSGSAYTHEMISPNIALTVAIS